jgi:hypothetical protein
MSRERRRERLGVEPRPVRQERVDASEAREHLIFLKSKKIGLRAVQEKIGVSESHMISIRSGEIKTINKQTANKILGFPAITFKGGQFVPSGEAKKLVAEMKSLGYSAADINSMIWQKPMRSLIIKNFIRYERLLKIKQVHSEVMRKAAK